ncbi:hypothetical protein L6R52_43565, partial [Myxococcota bacterium]|nr:hypothetical protein [Myxococcota bacterium]
FHAQQNGAAMDVTAPALYAPLGLAFDGGSIWAADVFGALYRVRPSDGVITYQATISGSPQELNGMGFDGTHLWFSTGYQMPFYFSRLIQVRVTDGAVVSGGYVEYYPGYYYNFDGLYVDQSYLYLVVSGCHQQVSPVTRQLRGSFCGASHLFGDGRTLYTMSGTTLQKRNEQTLAVTATLPIGASSTGMTSDGTYLWISLGASGVAKVRLADFALETVYPATAWGITYDGLRLIVSGPTGPQVMAEDGSLGPALASPEFPPTGPVSDTANLWWGLLGTLAKRPL